jgi:hypothetical protein
MGQAKVVAIHPQSGALSALFSFRATKTERMELIFVHPTKKCLFLSQ